MVSVKKKLITLEATSHWEVHLTHAISLKNTGIVITNIPTPYPAINLPARPRSAQERAIRGCVRAGVKRCAAPGS